jgi:hypothetical protein
VKVHKGSKLRSIKNVWAGANPTPPDLTGMKKTKSGFRSVKKITSVALNCYLGNLGPVLQRQCFASENSHQHTQPVLWRNVAKQDGPDEIVPAER